MAAKVGPFLDAVAREAGPDLAARDRALKRLDSFSVAQLLAAARFGQSALALRLMVSVTLVVAPVAMLLFFQLRFLPFHDAAITWWHRAMVLAELGLLWWLWPFTLPRRARATLGRGIAAGLVGSGAVAVFAVEVAVFPTGSRPDGVLEQAAAWLFDGAIGVDQRPTSLFSRRLVLPDEDFVPEDDKAREEMLRTRVLRGRHLEFAVLDRADLRKADLTGTEMQGASLFMAQMQGASLNGAQMQGASLDWAQMQGVSLARAQMQGASLFGAQMQGASLPRAQMQGASLGWAQMQGASLFWAQMQGVLLDGVQMQGAWLFMAQMQGASLRWAQMQDASLDGAHLWKARAASADTRDAQLSTVDPDAEPPCAEPTSADGRCPRERSWPQWVAAWLADIPEGQRRDAAAERLGILLVAPAAPSEDTQVADSWRRLPPPDVGSIARHLGDFACAADAARGVFQQIRWPPAFGGRDLSPHRATLAARIAGPDCLGARGLTDAERTHLAAIATGREPD